MFFVYVSNDIVFTTNTNRGRYLKGLALGTFGFCTSWAISSKGDRDEWVEIVHERLRLRNLPKQFENMRIVHVTDFHCSRTVSEKYLQRCIDRINALYPDIIVMTGDYITHDHTGRFSKRVSRLLSRLKSRYGIYASLGNHDYGIGGAIRIDRNGGLDKMISRFHRSGIRVLRNSAGFVQVNDHKLWFVGLGDLWAKDFEPARAFAQVDSDGPVITLSHNPESEKHLSRYDYDALFCGHTHGCRFEWTALPDRPVLIRRRFKSGMYSLGERSVYVNRGLGRHGRIFNKRPEITVFTLC